MKLFTPFLLVFMLGFSVATLAQSDLLADQNPQYLVSQAKYQLLADSLNAFHSTTLQNTYEAYDWYDAKQQRKSDRLQFRRSLRMLQAENYDRRNYDQPYSYYDSRYGNRNYNRYDNRNPYQYQNRYNRQQYYLTPFLFNRWCW